MKKACWSQQLIFFYEKDKVTKEIWYDGDTQDLLDETYHTYDVKGELIKTEASISDYTTINTYSDDGNLTSWFLSFGGVPYAKTEYTHVKHQRNPSLNIPGVDYDFPYANPAFSTGKSWYSSETVTFFDENGNGTVYYDQDPLLTQWQLGYQNFPMLVGYFDKQTGTYFSIGFEMENCGQENAASSRKANSGTVNNRKSVEFKSLHLILSGPRKAMKQRLDEFRRSHK